jgi:hypothetical protein
MLKKAIEYTDFNGVKRKEDFYFNLSKAELMEMELGVTGGMKQLLERIIQADDMPKLMKEFKDLILRSYGEKSADGKRFIKSKELSDAFSQTEAYSELFMELITDEKAAAAFANGIVPKELADEVQAQQAELIAANA